MKELVFKFLHFGGGCGGLERTDFLTVSTLGGVVVLKELILQFLHLGGLGGFVLKELISTSFYFQQEGVVLCE